MKTTLQQLANWKQNPTLTRDEIIQLIEDLESVYNVAKHARACLMNINPYNRTPIARQMSKMVDEISTVIDDNRPFKREQNKI